MIEGPTQLEIADVPVVVADQVDQTAGAAPVLEDSENHGNRSQIGNQSKTQDQEKWNTISKCSSKGSKVNVCVGDFVRFRSKDSEEWSRGVVTKSTGRAGAANQNTYNVYKENGVMKINCDILHVDKLQQLIEETVNNQPNVAERERELADSPKLTAAKQIELDISKKFGVVSKVKTVDSTVKKKVVSKVKDEVNGKVKKKKDT
jgi:hypothetical protein